MIWSSNETLSRSEIEDIQLLKLKKQVKYAYDNVSHYKNKMDEMGIKPEDITNLSDIQSLPFITKQDFRDTYPFGMFAVDRKSLHRVHASSGTTGRPTVVGYTKNDMENWTETVTRVAAAGGAHKSDVAQICFGYGMFTGALGLHYGLEHMGCEIIPASVGNTNKQIMFMEDLNSTILVATPSYALHLSESILQMGKKPSDFNLRIGLLGGEGISEKMRDELNEIWENKVLFTQNYGMSELNGPGIAGECEYLTGMHIMEDHFLAEIIDPETEEVLPAGSEGELVITCLTKEAIPLIRYRTRDITTLHYEKCECGRTTVRMEPLKGRSDDMLVIKGVNVFPSQIESVLMDIKEVGANYELVVETKNHMDNLELKVELLDYELLNSYKQLEELEYRIVNGIKEVVGLAIKVTLAAPRTLKRFEGKAKRVTDLRDK
ncbi:MAG: phenylacetate--CoA ligase [Tissierellia bacterium]|nr:phenylacetate--CoA ligase [Tissierellia bacterium]